MVQTVLDRLRSELPAGQARRVLEDVVSGRPTVWSPDRSGAVAGETVPPGLVDAAEDRFRWFAPLFEELFPETAGTGGILESPLVKVGALAEALDGQFGGAGWRVPGNLWVKRDDVLAVSGSVKSRGGVHEVLETALGAARELGVDLGRGPAVFLDPEVREVMSTRRIVVGSTGNLGMSIGLTGAALGFSVTVHMSRDARQWKKERLRGSGVEVVEHGTDFTGAVRAGRAAAAADPDARFIDDESSLSLFAGYAVAGRRLAGQLAALSVTVDGAHPLYVYLPCGVGGAPGGITCALSSVFGDAVRPVFVEPVAAPAFLLGRLTGRDDGISVAEVGLSGRTLADGLAVGRPSGLVGKAVGHLVDACVTVTDDDLLRTLALAHDVAGLKLEPSACAGLRAAGAVGQGQLQTQGTHVAWLTGGSFVPEDEFAALLGEGRRLLAGNPPTGG
ncbi:D-serine dehydratase [Corynebacterium provencense]|uniref:Probable D-serine dehydratase n=1 Tax=Corynebacterium provencense TaxID=1737425 RepID=A0A2Z3YWL5_9CORY|nr:D-serine ammonia-lyase [Corynebacterium provencense]AWT26954.1 D-serine dehydratase [Corynebacterium provencense]